jgi:5-formyltetrahydrofolate cyclo-ligase
MLISNELASLSNKLHLKSSQVFRNAKVTAFFADMNNESPNYEIIMDAENSELRKMFTECGDLYEKWFKQLESDVSKIRVILDFSGDFLEKSY